jgi:hypothetical protein
MLYLIKCIDDFYDILKQDDSPDVFRKLVTKAALMDTPLAIESLCRLATLLYNMNSFKSPQVFPDEVRLDAE